jgi:hypothetical protein
VTNAKRLPEGSRLARSFDARSRARLTHITVTDFAKLRGLSMS